MVGARGRLRGALAIGAASLTFAVPARAEETVCPAVWPARAPASSVSLAEPAALLALRDISQPGPGANGTSPLAVSPDGRRLAFFITQPVPALNDLCETLVVLDVSAPRDVRILNSGGSGIRYEEVLRGVRRPSGTFEVNIPVWSPDGRALIYRKRVAGRVQVWRADLEGRAPDQLSHAEHDVEAVAWSQDGKRVLYTVRPGRAAFIAARKVEAAKGYLYDARFLPHLAAEPQLPAELPEVLMALPGGDGRAVPASPADRQAFAPPSQWGLRNTPRRRSARLAGGCRPGRSHFPVGSDGLGRARAGEAHGLRRSSLHGYIARSLVARQ